LAGESRSRVLQKQGYGWRSFNATFHPAHPRSSLNFFCSFFPICPTVIVRFIKSPFGTPRTSISNYYRPSFTHFTARQEKVKGKFAIAHAVKDSALDFFLPRWFCNKLGLCKF
jgi:hypothetical protein